MLAYRVQKVPSPTRRSTLAAKIKRLGVTVMVSCTPCTRARALCVFSGDSSKCSKYTRKGVSCDGNFSEADFDRLLEEKDRLKAARTRAIAEAASLDKRIKALWKAQGAMIAREARALEELEREEERQAQQANVALDSVFDE
jgi:hypothetical protein